MSGKTAKPLGVVVATRWEAQGLLARFPFRRIERQLYQALIEDRTVLLAISGVGREPARRAAYRLCDHGAGELLSMGFCGALTPELPVGALVSERIATTDAPVRNRQEREALTRRANAVACDMETQAVMEAGTRRGVPIHALRAVSDRFEDDLTPLFGSDQRFSAWKIAWRLLRPGTWPLARQLRRNSQAARTRLAEALRQYLHESPVGLGDGRGAG